MIIDETNYLAHYGILRRSGRYPWGSGDNVQTRSKSFLDHIDTMKKSGLSEKDIAKGCGMSMTELRNVKTYSKNELKQAQVRQAQKLRDKGTGYSAIGRRMGINESVVRTLLAPSANVRNDILRNTSEIIKEQVDSGVFVDVGIAAEHSLGISRTNLDVAISMLVDQGYTVHKVPQPQIGTGKDTTLKVVCPPRTTQKEVFLNRNKVKNINQFSDDGGISISKKHSPISVSANRLKVLYIEDGGAKLDGVIYVRPGIPDLSMGKNNYGQVRIQVGKGHYLKGMAMYKDNLPEGVDLLFHANKHNTGNKLDALKPLTNDPDLPFGAVTRPFLKNIGTPKEKVASAINMVNEAGDWSQWTKSISSQLLSKQSPALIKSQLDKTYSARQQEFADIMSLTNPTVKKYLLEKFADGTDSAAVSLDAASFPRQGWHVILPINTLKPNEIYAPNFNNGEKVVLIRYPHAGTFEIPELVVNNKHKDSKNLIGGAQDAVGIHHTVAERLSGADFDGDTVLVIPNNSGQITHTKALDGLKDFNPAAAYPKYEGMKVMSNTQQEMGNISNLITDMTIKGAPQSDIARAVRHSMVVIDAEKKQLNYKQSAIDNGIKQLKQEYQGRSNAGASTLISRAGSKAWIPERTIRRASEGGPINPKTGEIAYVSTNKTHLNRKGERVPNQLKVEKLSLTNDAHTLSSGTKPENLYANHSNKLKDLANKTRLEIAKTPLLQTSPSAKKVYAKEISSLKSKLVIADMNRPLERQAQVLAKAQVDAKRQANPDLEPPTLKKIKYQALEESRSRLGVSKKQRQVQITPSEWNAIQAGAVSNNMLKRILDNANVDTIREYATPKAPVLMTQANTSRANAMLDLGYTRAEVATQLGVSLSTLAKALEGEGG